MQNDTERNGGGGPQTREKMFSRELVREVRALFFRRSSLERPMEELSAAALLLGAFCPRITKGHEGGEKREEKRREREKESD